jgi:long-chain acyl-CoA synthetase
VRVVDPLSGRDAAPREVGEVWVRAPNVMRGYFNRPDDTAAAISADGWLRTGDGGYLDAEGYLFLTDRIKDMIVTGGENVYPVEIEEVLAGHPGIEDVTVIGVPDRRWGETVLAIVVTRPDVVLTEDDVLEYGRARLAGFKRPRAVVFMETLPRNPSGKVLKKVLRVPYWA